MKPAKEGKNVTLSEARVVFRAIRDERDRTFTIAKRGRTLGEPMKGRKVAAEKASQAATKAR
jgi:hypothetical protein